MNLSVNTMWMTKRAQLFFLGLLALVLSASNAEALQKPSTTTSIAPTNISSGDAPFNQKSGVYGTITSVGSDSMASLMSYWAEGFQAYYPHIKFQIQATGSSTASQALTQGTANIGPMSRELTAAEIARFERVHGYPPTTLTVAVDAIGIFVQRNNPLDKLSIQQLDAMFSVTRWCGAPEAITSWHQLGVDKFHPERAIELFSRSSISGTYDLFKERALCGGDFVLRNNEMQSSRSVIQSVAASIGGIGYAALGHLSREVKALSISPDGQQFFAPSQENIQTGKYPFTRYLYIIINKSPDGSLTQLEKAFLNFILSAQGQSFVVKAGYSPVNQRLLSRQKSLLNAEVIPPDA